MSFSGRLDSSPARFRMSSGHSHKPLTTLVRGLFFSRIIFNSMSMLTPKRKVKTSFASPANFDYYLPDMKGVLILLLFLLAGALLGNAVMYILLLIPGAEGLNAYSMLISYPVMFIPAIIYASARSRFNQVFEDGEHVPVDSSRFGRLGGAVLALMSVIVTLAAAFLTDPVMKIMPPTPQWFDDLTEQMLTGTPLWATLLSVSVFAPLFEEWLCRGMVLRGLLRHMKPLWAMVISSLFFALIHMNPWQAVPAFLLGMLFAYVYYRTGSLKLTMLMHCTNNTFAALIGQNETFRQMNSYTEILPLWQYLTLVAASLFLVILFIRIVRKNSPAC